MTVSDLERFIRDVPDFPTAGIVFRDITPMLRDPRALRAALDHLVRQAAPTRPDLVAGIESRGFLFATPLAARLGAGFVPVRKAGKLPFTRIEESYQLEYGQSTLEVHEDAVRVGQRVLIVDDLLATGGTARAAANLVRRLGGEVAGHLFVVELSGLDGRRKLAGDRIDSLIRL